MKRIITLLLLCGLFLCGNAQRVYTNDQNVNELIYQDNAIKLRFPSSIRHDNQSKEGQCMLMLMDEENECIFMAITSNEKTENQEQFINDFISSECEPLPGTLKKTECAFGDIPGIAATFLTKDEDDKDNYNYFAIASDDKNDRTVLIICCGTGKDTYTRAESIIKTISWVPVDDFATRETIVDVVSLDDYMAEQYPDEDKVFDVVDDMPSFPGGRAALMQYLAKNIHYPVVAQEYGVEGRVIISFVVDKDGSITESWIQHHVSHIVKQVDPETGEETEFDAGELLNAEALRVVKTMPKWIPGKINGQPVKTKFSLPVAFKLQ